MIEPVGHEDAGIRLANNPEGLQNLDYVLSEFFNRGAGSMLGAGTLVDDLMEGREVLLDVNAVHGLLSKYQDHEMFGNVDLFLKYYYALCDEKTIFWDSDVPVRSLGYGLPADKVLVVKNRTLTGEKRTGNTLLPTGGLLVNFADSEDNLWSRESGCVLNFGNVANVITGFKGCAVNWNELTSFSPLESNFGIDVVNEDYDPTHIGSSEIEGIIGLPEYLDSLHDGFNQDDAGVREFVSTLGKFPAATIRGTLKELVSAAGVKVVY